MDDQPPPKNSVKKSTPNNLPQPGSRNRLATLTLPSDVLPIAPSLHHRDNRPKLHNTARQQPDIAHRKTNEPRASLSNLPSSVKQLTVANPTPPNLFQGRQRIAVVDNNFVHNRLLRPRFGSSPGPVLSFE